MLALVRARSLRTRRPEALTTVPSSKNVYAADLLAESDGAADASTDGDKTVEAGENSVVEGVEACDSLGKHSAFGSADTYAYSCEFGHEAKEDTESGICVVVKGGPIGARVTFNINFAIDNGIAAEPAKLCVVEAGYRCAHLLGVTICGSKGEVTLETGDTAVYGVAVPIDDGCGAQGVGTSCCRTDHGKTPGKAPTSYRQDEDSAGYGQTNEGKALICSVSEGRLVVGEESQTVCDTETVKSIGVKSYTQYTLIVYGSESACVGKVVGAQAIREVILYYTPSIENDSDEIHNILSKANLLSCIDEDVEVTCQGATDGIADVTAIDYVFYILREKVCEPESVFPGTTGSEILSLSASIESANMGKTSASCTAESTVTKLCETSGSDQAQAKVGLAVDSIAPDFLVIRMAGEDGHELCVENLGPVGCMSIGCVIDAPAGGKQMSVDGRTRQYSSTVPACGVSVALCPSPAQIT